MADRDDEPKSFLDRSIHWNDPAGFGRPDEQAPICKAPPIGQASTIGLVVGLIIVAMPLYDWPPSLGGILFGAAGLLLAGICLFSILQSQNIAAAQDRERVPSKDGDLAP